MRRYFFPVGGDVAIRRAGRAHHAASLTLAHTMPHILFTSVGKPTSNTETASLCRSSGRKRMRKTGAPYAVPYVRYHSGGGTAPAGPGEKKIWNHFRLSLWTKMFLHMRSMIHHGNK